MLRALDRLASWWLGRRGVVMHVNTGGYVTKADVARGIADSLRASREQMDARRRFLDHIDPADEAYVAEIEDEIGAR